MISGSRPALVIHPILLAVAWALNQGLSTEAEIRSIVRPVLVAAGLAAILIVIGWLALRNRWDGALVASVAILLLILPFPAIKLWESLGAQIGFVVLAVALTGIVGLPVLVAIHARRQGRPIPRPSPGRLNEFGLLLLLVVVATNTIDDAGTAVSRLTTPPPAVEVPATQDPLPDIVVILLDGYPRGDVLKRRLGIDNSEFLTGLADRGFDVAPDSSSNYVLTAPTLASMFQMRYLDEVDDVAAHIGSQADYHGLLRYAATSGPAWTALRDAGYEIVTAPPGWEHVRLDGASDRVVNDGQITDLERSLLEQTWLMDVVTLISPNLITDGLRDRLVSSFAALDNYAAGDREQPSFLFLHVPGPHPPLVVDAEGNAVPVDARALGADDPAAMHLTPEEYVARWEDELQYLNERVLQSIDRLQAADRSTLIVVMADHGYVQEIREDDPGARLSNLFAAYTPGAPGLLEDAPTPVNLMPRLLDEYLGTDFPESPDRYFLSPGPLEPLVLTEIEEPSVADGGS
jgi:hypothetical protein